MFHIFKDVTSVLSSLHTLKLPALISELIGMILLRILSWHSATSIRKHGSIPSWVYLLVWDPHLQKDIGTTRGSPKFALRICSKNYYKDLLDTFQLPELSTRRLYVTIPFMRLSMSPTIFLQIFLYSYSHCIMLSHTCITSHLHTQTLSFTHLCPALLMNGMLK